MEIGSEYYTASAKKGLNEYSNLKDCPKRYVLSGRTGLGLIAQEMRTVRGAKSLHILLPSYCCGSMIYPFLNEKIKVSFYDVLSLDNVVVDDSVDAVLVMDYFGFISEDTFEFSKRCKNEGKILIVDATQTAFSIASTYDIADFVVVSYRKWFDCLCGVVYSKEGFVTEDYVLEYSNYNELWKLASSLKRKFIKTGIGEKQNYLSMFAEANFLLDTVYRDFKANEEDIQYLESVDSAYVKSERRKNADVLISEIQKLSNTYNIELMYSKMEIEDCPLFVPVLVDENKRNSIRAFMSSVNVYCPTHWPVDRRYDFEETAYHRKEISLICDQRYNVEDMRFQVSVLIDALKKT